MTQEVTQNSNQDPEQIKKTIRRIRNIFLIVNVCVVFGFMFFMNRYLETNEPNKTNQTTESLSGSQIAIEEVSVNETQVAQAETMIEPQKLATTSTICRKEICRDLSLAQTEQERATGLMGRKEMPSQEGMLFVFEENKDWGFWMKDTLIPLDIIRLDENFVVVDVITMQPCTQDPCPVGGPRGEALYVLELNAGEAQKNGFGIGSVLRYSGPEL